MFFNPQLEGYFEGNLQYNFEDEKWEIVILGGGFTAGMGVNVTFWHNQWVGPVPITAELAIGGAIQLDFKVALRYEEMDGLWWESHITSKHVNDYMTTIRLNFTLAFFAGFGFDYTIVVLKVGLFG